MSIKKKIFGIDTDKRVDIPSGLRGSGVTGGKGIFDEYFNQALLETQVDHVVNTEAKVKQATPVEGTAYYNSTATEFQDKNDATVTFVDGDRILWRGLDVITALIDISTVDYLEHIMWQGFTIPMLTYDLDLGENQRGELDLSGTGTLTILGSDGLRVKSGAGLTIDNQDGDIVINNVISTKQADFTSKDLIINVLNNTQVGVTAESLSLLNSDNVPAFLFDIDDTYDITTDKTAGTELVDTLYGIWKDSDGNKKLAPDLTGNADSIGANQLKDSGASFLTYLVHENDIIYNLDDKTSAVATADASAEGIVNLSADIFPSGNEAYRIVMMSPVGLGENRERVGSAYNNGSGNLDDSTYTQIQEEKEYSEAAGDFAVTGTNWATDASSVRVTQVNDWMGVGSWVIKFNIAGTMSPGSSVTTETISGIIFDDGADQGITCYPNGRLSFIAYANANTGQMICQVGSTTTVWSFAGDVKIIRKPTFHN